MEKVLPARLLLAVSGGPDSMALADLALRWSRETGAFLALGHVNHRLRGRASDADAAFVRQWADRNNLSFKVVSVDARGWARRNKRGLEEAARILRYQALAKMARILRCPVVATAHTLDDQAETVFMNLVRGTGPSGLAGMSPVSGWPVGLPPSLSPGPTLLRPLLSVRKEALLRYLRDRKIPCRIDATNDLPLFFRNRVRPVLKTWDRERPGLFERVGHLADILRDEERFWSLRLADAGGPLEVGSFKRYSIAEQRRRLRRSFNLSSFEALERARAFALDPGPISRVSVPGGWMEKRGGILFFRPLA